MIEENSGSQSQENGGKSAEVVPESLTHSVAQVPPAPTIKERPLPDQTGTQIAATDPARQIKEATDIAEEAIKPFERQMLRLTLWGIGVAAITAVIFYVQLREMARQTEILASQSESGNAGALFDQMNTRKELQIAQQQAQSAQDAVGLASKESAENAKRVERQLKTLQDQVRATRDQADAALRSAIAIQKQTEISERPWLSVDATPVDGLIFVNGQQPVLKVKLSFKNVGRKFRQTLDCSQRRLGCPLLPTLQETSATCATIRNPLRLVGSTCFQRTIRSSGRWISVPRLPLSRPSRLRFLEIRPALSLASILSAASVTIPASERRFTKPALLTIFSGR